MLFSEPKIPQSNSVVPRAVRQNQVSVLFSEPKIPQLYSSSVISACVSRFQCSSASRKFLNYSRDVRNKYTSRSFSALQRAENSSIETFNVNDAARLRFSALQRAENSSIARLDRLQRRAGRFQCSSASRKFLNIVRRMNVW